MDALSTTMDYLTNETLCGITLEKLDYNDLARLSRRINEHISRRQTTAGVEILRHFEEAFKLAEQYDLRIRTSTGEPIFDIEELEVSPKSAG